MVKVAWNSVLQKVNTDSGGLGQICENCCNPNLFKINNAGNLIWTRDTGSNVLLTCDYYAGFIYCIGQGYLGNTLWKFDDAGNLIWSIPVQATSSVAVSPAGYIYVAGASAVSPLEQYDLDGNFNWSKNLGVQLRRVATDSDGNVYLTGNRDSTPASVWVYDKDGNSLWTYDTGNTAYGISVDTGVSIPHVRSGGVSVTRLTKGGGFLWSYDTTGTALLTRSKNNVIYVVGFRAGGISFWKLTSGGALSASYDTGHNTLGVDADSNGNIYICGTRSGNKSVWKINSTGTLLWDYDTGKTTERLVAKKTVVFLDNAAAVDLGGVPNKVNLPATGHGFLATDIIEIQGTINYDGIYTISTATIDNFSVVSVYNAETFNGDETITSNTADNIYIPGAK